MSKQLRDAGVVALVVAIITGLVAVTTPLKSNRGHVFRGVWHDGFERAAFYEGYSSRKLPNLYETADCWLTFEQGVWPAEAGSPEDPDWYESKLFEIEFSGRLVEGQTGHLGEYPAECVAERVIKIERLDLEAAARASTPLEGKQR